MSTATSGATIFYTTDGTTPTHNGSNPTGTTQVYTTPYYIGRCNDIFFEAVAWKLGMADSDATTFEAKSLSGCTGGGGTGTTTTILSVWDGDWAILEEYSFSGTTSTLLQGYLQGYHGLVKTLVDNIYYYQDELGSTSHITDTHGALLEYYKYDLYGKPQFFSSTSQQLNSSTYSVAVLGNGGSRWMPELGLYDDRNRFMSPDLGRFLQPDPIGFKGDASNLYRYCGNDWANRTDPMGTEAQPQNNPTELISKEKLNATARGEESERGALLEGVSPHGTIQVFKSDGFSNEVSKAIANAPRFAQNGPGDPRSSGFPGYQGGQKAVDEAQHWLAKHHPELHPKYFKIVDHELPFWVRMAAPNEYGGWAGYPGSKTIYIDTTKWISERQIVTCVAHELMHRRTAVSSILSGVAPWERKIQERSTQIGIEYFLEEGNR